MATGVTQATLGTKPRYQSFVEKSALERDLVVEIAAAAEAWAGLSEIRAFALVADLAVFALTAAFTATVQHGQGAVKALQNHLGGPAVIAILVLPFAGLQCAFKIDLGALFQILLGNLAQALGEYHHTVPLGLFPALAGILVAPAV